MVPLRTKKLLCIWHLFGNSSIEFSLLLFTPLNFEFDPEHRCCKGAPHGSLHSTYMCSLKGSLLYLPSLSPSLGWKPCGPKKNPSYILVRLRHFFSFPPHWVEIISLLPSKTAGDPLPLTLVPPLRHHYTRLSLRGSLFPQNTEQTVSYRKKVITSKKIVLKKNKRFKSFTTKIRF